MNENELMEIGKRLQDQARREVALLQFMLKEADPKVWAKAHQEGGNWQINMNKLRSKRAATKAEATEIIRLARRINGTGEDCIEFLQHALYDPAWALYNLRYLSEHLFKGVVI